jgi:acyl-CoA synthetase (AMP-forming)/AMP-acid ligase II
MFTLAFLGIMNAAILFAPLNPDLQAKLAGYLNPAVVLLAFLFYRAYDRWWGK